jgi:diguanylate cyclase (GGDEF)-like protein
VTTLEQDQAIERILEELNQVVPYDSASVLLTHGLDMEIVGARGFENPNDILNLRFALTEETPNKVVFETRKPYVLDDAQEKYSAFTKPPHNHIHGWMGIPLLLRDRLIGMLALDSQQPGRFNEDHARLASAFADQVVIALENARLFEETRRLAITDSLTNLYNRRHFMELARQEFERARRYKTPLAIIMLDIDLFKNINDTYGHLVGDQVLQTTAYICRKNLRTVDTMGRFGGEEFVIMLPETTLTRPPDKDIETEELSPLPAQIVAERLLQKVANETFEIGENSIKVTISLGVAEFKTSDFNIENVIDHADQALLQAKNQGRNKVVIWTPEENLA